MDDGSELKREVLDVRKVIEKSTSKVSLRDLEKKGFRQVKVLRAGDINQLIFKAVQNVLAKQPRSGMTEEERQQIVKEARTELDRQLKEKKQIAADKTQIEEAKLRLEAKVNELNQQMANERRQFEAEKREFTVQKQSLFEKSLENQKQAATNYQDQINDLRKRLESAETRRDRLEAEAERLREELVKAKEDMAGVTHGSGLLNADAAELQRMRMEAEQRDQQMKSMIEGLANTLAGAGGGGGNGGDLSKQFKSLQLSLSDQIRKGMGSMGRGGQDFDLSPEAAAALFAGQADDVQMETNIRDIKVEEKKAAGVNDKLAKLRNLRKK